MDEKDTVVIPALPKGFNEVFIGENRWPSLKIDRNRRQQIKYIAVYQAKPISAITHYARVKEFRDLEAKGRCSVTFEGEPIEINAVRFTAMDTCAVQGPRYTTLDRLLKAQRLDQAFT